MAIEMVAWEILESGDERIDGLFAEKEAVFAKMHKIAATTISKGNHRATGG